MRENFKTSIIQKLRQRVAEKCSNPDCKVATSGPHTDIGKSVTTGVAAHICAASAGGPRFDAQMSQSERSNIKNAIWLCQNCSKLIDNDALRYTPTVLIEWKINSELLAENEISKRPLKGNFPKILVDTCSNRIREVIELGDNNELKGTTCDLENLAIRCATNVIKGEEIEFEIQFLPTQLKSEPSDPLWRPKSEAIRKKKAGKLADWLKLLTAPKVYNCWKHYLTTVADWHQAISALINRAQISFSITDGHKIDVWRTSSPTLIAPVFLTNSEIEELLKHLKFENTRMLRSGPFWRAAADMPHSIVTKHVIPAIVFELVKQNILPDDDVLNLMEWHIGEG